MKKVWILAVAALALAVLAVLTWRQPAAHVTPKTQVAAVRVPLGAGAAQFLQTHKAILAQAALLERPTALPTLLGADGEASAAVAPAAPQSLLPPVPPEQQVHLAFTSSAMGELDPCG